jgi:hypothetical protein
MSTLTREQAITNFMDIVITAVLTRENADIMGTAHDSANRLGEHDSVDAA